MRSAIGPLLVLFGLATTVVLVLLLFGNLGTRSELEALRGELAALRAEVGGSEAGVSNEDLAERLDDLETAIDGLLLDDGDDGASPSAAPSPGGDDEVVARLDEVLDRIEALDERIDEICGNVPVC